MIDSVQALIDEAFQARRDDRPADALSGFSSAVDLAREHGQRTALVRALKGLGQIHRDGGDRAKALELYREATTVCREIDDPLLLAHTVRHVADILQDEGRVEEAAPLYEEALAIYRAEPETIDMDLANALRPYAILTESFGEKGTAIALWTETRQLYEKAGILPGVHEADAHLETLR
jgi:tetratricopeptide (TPR) repeat protein